MTHLHDDHTRGTPIPKPTIKPAATGWQRSKEKLP